MRPLRKFPAQRLADSTFYEVDFLVLQVDMCVAIHEVKGGHTTDKGQVKSSSAPRSCPGSFSTRQ